MRASLYKIATNAALNLAQRRSRRELPASYGPCAPSGERAGPPPADAVWLELYSEGPVAPKP